ncbi:MAG: DsbA family protein [Candidatus Woesearchaeota archaeon]
MAKKTKTTSVRKSASTQKKDVPAKSNPWVVAVIVLGVLLFISLVANAVLATLLVVSAPTTATAPTQVAPQQQQAPSGGPVEVDLESAHLLGDPSASVVMVEYSSFTCPFCGRFHAETFGQIKSNFVDTGDVLYAYKHFIRSPDDARIANVAECAAEQGDFFAFIDQVYSNQHDLSDAALRRYAENLGLDVSELDSCVSSGRNQQVANDHVAEARANGISGTPSFLINGERLVGAQPYPVFEQALRSAQ